MRSIAAAGAAFGFLGVLFGAFGAHALKDQLSLQSMAVYETGVHYQLIHAVALLAIGLLATKDRALTWVGWMMSVGIVLFSFSLYALAITGIRGIGAITPFGGVCFLTAWAVLFAWSIKRPA